MKKVLTLTLVRKNDQLLLGLKKRGFGVGLWNGFGGKVTEGETIRAGAERELFEEAGIRAEELMKVGELDFEFEGDPVILETHVYRVLAYTGEPVETEEMRPQWYGVAALPEDQMWPDDPFWMPFFLADKKFKGVFLYKDQKTLLSHRVWEVAGFPEEGLEDR